MPFTVCRSFCFVLSICLFTVGCVYKQHQSCGKKCKCDIFVCLVFGRQSWGSPSSTLSSASVSGSIACFHFSFQHLLPLTFRPTPHTLFPQRMLHARGHSETHSTQLQGISPGAVHMCVCVLCLCVCPLPGDSQSCRLRG